MTDSLLKYTGGLVGLIVLVLDIIAIFEILQSARPVVHKLLWALLIICFPLLGLILYFLLSRRRDYGLYSALP
ncbi:hypothetical protein F8M41_016152 [Gigaspora margarita]|uniref:Cardiolipin synthase N-terminal domain-containing protein n=1 Tax=Gigaspora margarita TaxID=4874 RepID=A0A8H3WT85_GIGMA|nr:hypothetical protein F8M41_016152 [Gigaspora margarita]